MRIIIYRDSFSLARAIDSSILRVSIRAHHSLYTQKRVLGHTFNHVILYTSASARGAISSWTPPSLHAALCSYQGAKMTNRRGPPPAPHETRS